MTDCDKWKKPFIKSLTPHLKLFWLFILDDCDHAGVWHVDIEVAELRLGIKINKTEALKAFGEKVFVINGGNMWFIPDFITFQYGELTVKNKMYKPVSSILKKYNLMGHLSPINGGKEKEEDKVKDKEIDEQKAFEYLRRAAPVFIPDADLRLEVGKMISAYEGKKIENLAALCNRWASNIKFEKPQITTVPLRKIS